MSLDLKLEDLIREYMNLDRRLKIDLDELSVKISDLEKFLDESGTCEEMIGYNQFLRVQLDAMKAYAHALTRRLEVWDD